MSELTELLKDESIRHWIWWTILPLALITGVTIVYVVDRFFKRTMWKNYNPKDKDLKDE